MSIIAATDSNTSMSERRNYMSHTHNLRELCSLQDTCQQRKASRTGILRSSRHMMKNASRMMSRAKTKDYACLHIEALLKVSRTHTYTPWCKRPSHHTGVMINTLS